MSENSGAGLTQVPLYIYIKKSNEIRMLVHIKEIINKKEQDNFVPEDLRQQ